MVTRTDPKAVSLFSGRAHNPGRELIAPISAHHNRPTRPHRPWGGPTYPAGQPRPRGTGPIPRGPATHASRRPRGRIGAPGALATGLGAHGSTHIGTLQTCPQSAHTCSGAARTHPATGARGRPGATRVFARPSLPPAAAARNGPQPASHPAAIMPTRAVALPARSSPAVPPSWRLRACPLRALPLTAPKRARVTRRHREIAGCCGPARSRRRRSPGL